MAQATYDVLMKCIVIGDMATGKSCMLHRFTEDKFLTDCTPTIGVEFGAKVFELMGKQVKMQIWDTAGQERYRGVTRSYYRGAAACLLVYDITSRESFNHVEKWLADARLLAGPDIAVMLVGNKCDLAYTHRAVQADEGKALAEQNGMLFFETSAMSGEYISEAFLKIAKTVLMRQSDLQTLPPATDPETIELPAQGKDKPKKKKGFSC
eukprot:Rhum_TRINITY_DN621_c0_g1::Rhum_TRINITY_DN621_c0_g1_i1::g.1993::m.1993/K07881/RAB14; Ras-related protein Rab-14